MSKTIGILTLHRSLNYGAVWQCWALKTVCEKLGYNVEIIDYYEGDRKIISFLRHRPDKILKYVRMNRHFKRFLENKIPMTERYWNNQSLEDNPPNKDIIIVGSDQVWSEKIVGVGLAPYILDFVPIEKLRVAYAASMGGTFPSSASFIDSINRFHAISLREPTFVNHIVQLSGRNVQDVCDPTLLVEANVYRGQENRYFHLPKHYLVYQDLDGEDLVRECALDISHRLNLPIVNISGFYAKWANRNVIGPSLESWLWIIDHADFVCTNSFHGTSFSIIFRKPFICVSGVASTCNNRMMNLLDQCGLMSQYVDDKSKIMDAIKINYDKSEESIHCYIDRSINWLKNSLEDEQA